MITSQVSKAGPYAADGRQRVFPFGFRVTDGAHLTVYRNDSPVQAGEYTVSLTDNGGNVTFANAPASGDTIAVIRNVPATQEVDLQNNTAFLPQVLEDAFDKLTMLVQQLRETLTRTLTVPPTQEIDQNTLFEEFRELAENAETWAEAAQTGCEQAVAAMNAAAESMNNARNYRDQASGYAGVAERSADISETARTSIQSLADLADLNYANIVFGDWSDESGAYIAFNPWTPASDIASLPATIQAHNDDASANSAAFEAHNADLNAHDGLTLKLAASGVYPQAAVWPLAICDLADSSTLKGMAGTYLVYLSETANGPETGTGTAILKVDSRIAENSDYWIALHWQNCSTGKNFRRVCSNGTWSGWSQSASESAVDGKIGSAIETAAGTYGLRMGYQEFYYTPGSTEVIDTGVPYSVELLRTFRCEVQLIYLGVPGDDTVERWGTYNNGTSLLGGDASNVTLIKNYGGHMTFWFSHPAKLYVWHNNGVIDLGASSSSSLRAMFKFRIRYWY